MTSINLWLIEDNCEALGAKYLYNGEWKYTGAIGHMAIFSFYPPNNITIGEGGAVKTNGPQLKRLVNPFETGVGIAGVPRDMITPARIVLNNSLVNLPLRMTIGMFICILAII